jgi:hypothetical protein
VVMNVPNRPNLLKFIAPVIWKRMSTRRKMLHQSLLLITKV